VLAVETDDAWASALRPLEEAYPHVVRQPQDNWDGLMLYSRLPLIDARVDFLVQDDIPSVHAVFELEGGVRVFLHGIHPRPPEPIRDQDSTPRDAELVVMGRAIEKAGDRPTVVAGDLNDVAWSPTSELFVRLSGLLDPRKGRGMFNSWNAKMPLLRYPLDHVFHSNHFRLVELRRLPSIGSDHFPMLIELSYEPQAKVEQPEPEKKPDDEEEADERLEAQAQAAATGDDMPGRE
jgi:endonuclease/exonuclease/phosphatase (EEP) superfamily protein YafD